MLLHNSSKIPLDIIGILESKQLINSEFPTNVDINDYQLHSQPTKVPVEEWQYVLKNLLTIKF